MPNKTIPIAIVVVSHALLAVLAPVASPPSPLALSSPQSFPTAAVRCRRCRNDFSSLSLPDTDPTATAPAGVARRSAASGLSRTARTRKRKRKRKRKRSTSGWFR